MSIFRQSDSHITPQEYLDAERLSETKHEYLAGATYAMAGASRAHNLIAANLLGELRNQLRGRRCAAFGSDMRLRILRPGAAFYYYPDVTVDCSDSQADEVDSPSAIFEILSPATERADRGDKLLNYQAIASMRYYALASQHHPNVTLYCRDGDGLWAAQLHSGTTTALELPDIGCTLPMSAIYERVFAAP